jgi:hypothetical protein
MWSKIWDTLPRCGVWRPQSAVACSFAAKAKRQCRCREDDAGVGIRQNKMKDMRIGVEKTTSVFNTVSFLSMM